MKGEKQGSMVKKFDLLNEGITNAEQEMKKQLEKTKTNAGVNSNNPVNQVLNGLFNIGAGVAGIGIINGGLEDIFNSSNDD